MTRWAVLLLSVALASPLFAADDTRSQFQNSWNFYSKRVGAGANPAERLSILDRILTKYANAGVDLSAVKEERRKVAAQIQPIQPAPPAVTMEQFNNEWSKYQNQYLNEWGNDELLKELDRLETIYGHLPKARQELDRERQTLMREIEEQRAKSKPKRAEPRAPLPGPSFLFQLDYWTPNGAYELDKEEAESIPSDLLAAGYDSAAAEINISAGLGFRAGLLFPTRVKDFRVGASFGYVVGPTSEAEIIGRSSFAGDGKTAWKDETTYLRALFELIKIFPLGKSLDLSLRGGVGVARGEIDTAITNSGTFVTTFGAEPSFSTNNDWTGLTWEVVPSFVIKSGSVNLEIGIGYAHFPTMSENDDYNEFEWNPVALRLGLGF